MNNLELFIQTYAKNLKQVYGINPQAYRFTYEETLERVVKVIPSMTFDKNTESFRRTCKELAIKHTYKAIAEFISA